MWFFLGYFRKVDIIFISLQQQQLRMGTEFKSSYFDRKPPHTSKFKIFTLTFLFRLCPSEKRKSEMEILYKFPWSFPYSESKRENRNHRWEKGQPLEIAYKNLIGFMLISWWIFLNRHFHYHPPGGHVHKIYKNLYFFKSEMKMRATLLFKKRATFFWWLHQHHHHSTTVAQVATSLCWFYS